ncbi:hypothetical protein KIPB_010055, partial [Kipferlia bialata]
QAKSKRRLQIASLAVGTHMRPTSPARGMGMGQSVYGPSSGFRTPPRSEPSSQNGSRRGSVVIEPVSNPMDTSPASVRQYMMRSYVRTAIKQKEESTLSWRVLLLASSCTLFAVQTVGDYFSLTIVNDTITMVIAVTGYDLVFISFMLAFMPVKIKVFSRAGVMGKPLDMSTFAL